MVTAAAMTAASAIGSAAAAAAPTLSTIGAIATVGSTVAGVVNAKNQANATQQVENYDATIANQNANAANANASSKANIQSLQTANQLSNARAAAAGMGGDPNSPSTVNIEEQIAGRGEYDQLSDIYTGNTQAASYKNQANLDEFAGQQAQKAVLPQQFSTIASGASTLFTKYGFGNQAGGQGGSSYFADSTANANFGTDPQANYS